MERAKINEKEARIGPFKNIFNLLTFEPESSGQSRQTKEASFEVNQNRFETFDRDEAERKINCFKQSTIGSGVKDCAEIELSKYLHSSVFLKMGHFRPLFLYFQNS